MQYLREICTVDVMQGERSEQRAPASSAPQRAALVCHECVGIAIRVFKKHLTSVALAVLAAVQKRSLPA